ncbi:MAG: GNAT family N-acetyltransferase [Capsulimonadales bacterium]|nr:GNAT family N-acetyltransferase [Capsulimonadales bacterium]
MEWTVRQIGAQELPLLYGLRARVLRPGRSMDSAVFSGDDDPATLHIGAFLPAGDCIGVVTLMENKGTQLRGMAVLPEWQRKGVGATLVQEAQRMAAERGITSLWCNARVAAAGFYERMGWTIESEEFEVPGVGPHYVMRYRMTSDEV